MDNNISKESSVLNTYLDNMRQYCNKYDNIAILNQVRAIGAGENIVLADVYTNFSLVSKEEYDQGNKRTFSANFANPRNPFGSDGRGAVLSDSVNNRLDVDQLVKTIDKKIYKLEVEEVLGNSELDVRKEYLYIFVIKVEKEKIECRIKINPDDIETSTEIITLNNNPEYMDKIINRWVWVRGYSIRGVKEHYYLLEPHWYREEKELTEKEKEFRESEEIIESKPIENDDKSDGILGTISNNDINKNQDSGSPKINGMVVLSEPGGGKTTYLKHYIYQLLTNNDISSIPFFVRTRDITSDLGGELQGEDIFNRIIETSIQSIMQKTEDSSDFIVPKFVVQSASGYSKLLVIDGFEELNDFQAQRLLECLDIAYEKGIISKRNDTLIISSRYKEYGFQKLADYCLKNGLEEKYIKFDKVDECVDKWFDILKTSGRDYQAYFNKMRTTNSDIGRLITTPLELTGLIMLCQSQSTLPTDISMLYRSILEIWLENFVEGTSIPFFSLTDIFLELSSIAFCMSEYEEEKLRISRSRIVEIIQERRRDMRRYYRSNAYVDASSDDQLGNLIDFWLNRNIFVRNSNDEIYEFAHREYQSYLTSYCIVNNLIPKLKNEKRIPGIERFRKHMDEADDFWDRVIVFSCFMSTNIHDDIIDYIFDRLGEESGKSTNATRKEDEYLLSILLQLTNAEGFYFADDEYQLLFDELFKNIDRLKIMKKSVKGSEIKLMLLNARKDNNTLFLNKCVEILESSKKRIEDAKKQNDTTIKTLKDEKSKIIDILSNIVFHITWNCDADRNAIKSAFQLYLDNWISMDIIHEIKDSLRAYHFNEERIGLIKEICRDAITRMDDPLSDCFMILAIICAYKKEDDTKNFSPYQIALQYFEKADYCIDEIEKNEAILIAINIMFLTTWFLQENEAAKCDCELKNSDGSWKDDTLEEFKACVSEICFYMKKVQDISIYSRDLMATYRDLRQLRCSEIHDEIRKAMRPFDCDVFRNCLQLCEKSSVTKASDDNELSYPFEILVQYPLRSDCPEMCEVICEAKKVLSKRIADIENCRVNKATTEKIYLLKLLVMAGKYDHGDNAVHELSDEINHIAQRLPVAKTRLIENEIVKEIKDYLKTNMVEGQWRLFDIDNYEELMNYMDAKINEL